MSNLRLLSLKEFYMYINEVVSYLGAWDTFKNEHGNLLEELQLILKKSEEKAFEEYKFYKDLKEYKPSFNFLAFIKENLTNELERMRWESDSLASKSNENTSFLGLMKESCYIKLTTSAASSILMSWIYRDIAFAKKQTNVSIPVLLVLDFSAQEFLNKIINTHNSESFQKKRKNLKYIRKSLDSISPLKFEHPFLILGIEVDENLINVQEIEHEIININPDIKIERCITFEPEYYQAGLGILNYFGTILRDKYPDQNATVKIEQHELTVRMTVETKDGNTEILEKALHEYELVLRGEVSTEDFFMSPIKALELKTQLRIFELQIESQKDIIALQQGMIVDLKQLATQALSQPPVTVINQLQNTQTTTINTKSEFNQSYDDLENLIDLTDSEALRSKLEAIQNALEITRNFDKPEEIKDSGAMKKLAKFLKEANEVGTEANTLAEKGGKALDLIKSLARRYNSIAEWCGMPSIPRVLVKE